MERQRRERTERNYEDMPLVLDQRLDRSQQRFVELVGKAEIEQNALFLDLVEIGLVFRHVDVDFFGEQDGTGK